MPLGNDESRDAVIRALGVLAFLAMGMSAVAQTPQEGTVGPPIGVPPPRAAAPSTRPALRISLEKKTADGKVQAVASDHVFEQGDTVHFKLQSDFDGYVYVLDQGTSGKFTTVYPSAEARSDNHVRQGQLFSIPSLEDSWFEISGPAGFDVLYFLLSPNAIATPPPSSFTAPVPANSLHPRCNDEIFRARGECTDMNAGPAPLARDVPLPAPLASIAGMASRDITVVKSKDMVTVGASGNKTAPVIYTFRVAHH